MRQDVSLTEAIIVAVAGASAVMLGAAGAHALRHVLDPAQAQIWHTAVNYHFWHALALTLTVVGTPRGRARRFSVMAFAVGIVLFSGSLYLLALGAPRWTGIITPFGGVAFIAGWVALGVALRRREAP